MREALVRLKPEMRVSERFNAKSARTYGGWGWLTRTSLHLWSLQTHAHIYIYVNRPTLNDLKVTFNQSWIR